MVFFPDPQIVQGCKDRDVVFVVFELLLPTDSSVLGGHNIDDDLNTVLPNDWSVQHKYVVELKIENSEIAQS